MKEEYRIKFSSRHLLPSEDLDEVMDIAIEKMKDLADFCRKHHIPYEYDEEVWQ